MQEDDEIAEELFLGNWNTFSEAVESLRALPFEPIAMLMVRNVEAQSLVEIKEAILVDPNGEPNGR